jgi:hypothetical protein
VPTPRKYASRAVRQRAYRARCEEARIQALKAKNMPPAGPIPAMPSQTRWKALIREAAAILRTVQEEMESYRDERSEAWQESERAEAFQERIDRLEEACEGIEAVE